MAEVGDPLVLWRGEKKSFTFTITDALTGAVLNLTSALGRFTVRKQIPAAAETTDTAAVFTLTVGSGIVLTDPTNGKLRVDFVQSNTNSLPSYPPRYYYGLEVVLSGETDPRVIGSGFLTLKGDVVRGAPA